MKKVLSVITMLIFVAGFAMAQTPTTQKNSKAVANKEAKANTGKKGHVVAKHQTGKKVAGKKAAGKKVAGKKVAGKKMTEKKVTDKKSSATKTKSTGETNKKS